MPVGFGSPAWPALRATRAVRSTRRSQLPVARSGSPARGSRAGAVDSSSQPDPPSVLPASRRRGQPPARPAAAQPAPRPRRPRAPDHGNAAPFARTPRGSAPSRRRRSRRAQGYLAPRQGSIATTRAPVAAPIITARHSPPRRRPSVSPACKRPCWTTARNAVEAQPAAADSNETLSGSTGFGPRAVRDVLREAPRLRESRLLLPFAWWRAPVALTAAAT